MPQEIINSLKSTSIVRAVDAGVYTITLANLATTAAETVSSASIRSILWSTGNSITITRNALNVATLYNSGEWKLSEIGANIATNNTSSIVITITTTGSIVLELAKESTYSTNLETL